MKQTRRLFDFSCMSEYTRLYPIYDCFTQPHSPLTVTNIHRTSLIAPQHPRNDRSIIIEPVIITTNVTVGNRLLPRIDENLVTLLWFVLVYIPNPTRAHPAI